MKRASRRAIWGAARGGMVPIRRRNRVRQISLSLKLRHLRGFFVRRAAACRKCRAATGSAAKSLEFDRNDVPAAAGGTGPRLFRDATAGHFQAVSLKILPLRGQSPGLR